MDFRLSKRLVNKFWHHIVQVGFVEFWSMEFKILHIGANLKEQKKKKQTSKICL